MRFLHLPVLLAFSVAAHAKDCEAELPTDVAVVAFAADGAPTAIVAAMPGDLAAALDADARLEACIDRDGVGAPAAYILSGTVVASGKRAFVALRLQDAQTSERVWFENYDCRGISAEMMAQDILRYLNRALSLWDRR